MTQYSKMFDFNVYGHIFQLFGLYFLSYFNISCQLDSQIRGEKDSLPQVTLLRNINIQIP